MNNITLKPIGYVKNNINSHEELMAVNPAGVKSSLMIYDEYLTGLYNIQECSHIMVCCYMDKANYASLTGQHKKFGIKGKERGVFASRSPSRPNHIAITVTRLLEIKNNELIVERFDMFNNTPILDIKAYSEGMDLVFNTRSLNKKFDYHKAPEIELYAYFKDMILNYVYNIDASLDLGIYSIIKILKTLKKLPDRDIIDSIETDYINTALDSLYYFSKYTPGEAKIHINNINRTKNSYIKLKLKSGEILQLTNENNSNSININNLKISQIK